MYGLNSSGSGQGVMAAFCEHGNESPIKWEGFLLTSQEVLTSMTLVTET